MLQAMMQLSRNASHSRTDCESPYPECLELNFAGLPDIRRKNLVWMSEAFPSALTQLELGEDVFAGTRQTTGHRSRKQQLMIDAQSQF